MHFLSEDLENYANEHTDNEPILLQELSNTLLYFNRE